MKLPSVEDFPVEEKRIILRTDFDGDSRIGDSLETIKFLLSKNCTITIISHLGRPTRQFCGRGEPDDKVVEKLSLRPVAERLGELLRRGVGFVRELESLGDLEEKITLLENLRFWPEEENNDEVFAKRLADLGDIFVNEAFAVSHRRHASIVGIPKLLPGCAGFHFLKEVETLSQVRENPTKPVVLVLGGAKEDKLKATESLMGFTDFLLIGGKLPLLVAGTQASTFKAFKRLSPDKIITAELNREGKDITLESVNKFEGIIAQAGTIIWAGPMGVFEEEKFANGTREIVGAIAESKAFKIAGGGETEAALERFGLREKFDFVSSGGGAMLEFLGKGTLPGIEAISPKL